MVLACTSSVTRRPLAYISSSIVRSRSPSGVSVSGEAVGRERSPQELLAGRWRTQVELELKPKGSRTTRRVAVRTMPSEHLLRYRDWVERNRAIVHERTGGTVGYVHVPDMPLPILQVPMAG